ncbi:transcriptional regulator [Bifidobacterium asteroides]|nr:transcriptional regulator [Bifidobacterium asteroides]
MIQMTDSTDNEKSRDYLADVAELYWIQGMKIERVAREMGISRSTVSRLIARARKEHVVEFIVHRTKNSALELENRLIQKYHVRVVVADTSDNADNTLKRMAVGKSAAVWLNTLIHSNTTIGVAWGRTIEAMSLQLQQRHLPGMRILQLHGFGNSQTFGENYATQILSRFHKNFDATVRFLPLPAIFDSENTKNLMYQESSIRKILELRKQMNLLITSVGTPNGSEPSPLFTPGLLSSKDIKALHEQKVIGNLASTFYRADGSTSDIDLNSRSTGLNRTELMSVASRLFLAASPSKAQALHVALRSGFVTHLVVDRQTAVALLKL